MRLSGSVEDLCSEGAIRPRHGTHALVRMRHAQALHATVSGGEGDERFGAHLLLGGARAGADQEEEAFCVRLQSSRLI